MERALLTPREIMRALPSLALFLVALFLVALPAGARAQTITAMIQPFGGRTGSPVQLADVSGGRPISRQECESDTTIPVQLTNVPVMAGGVMYTVVDVFSALSSTASVMCEAPANRTSTGSSAPPCTHVNGVAATIDSRSTFTMNLSPRLLFTTSATTNPCASGTATTRVFYLFPATGENDISTPFTNFTTLTITLDPEPPGAPQVGGPAAGDASIDVTFETPTAQLYEARLYVDRAGCPDGTTPSSSVLVAGSAPSGTPVATNQSATPSAIETSGAALGLDYDQSAAVAVTFVDRARNESVLSNVVCVSRVQVPGFWDSYCAERGLSVEACRQRYGSCATSTGRSSAALPIAGLGLALLALMRRRAR